MKKKKTFAFVYHTETFSNSKHKKRIERCEQHIFQKRHMVGSNWKAFDDIFSTTITMNWE
jgi:hypothetical protein